MCVCIVCVCVCVCVCVQEHSTQAQWWSEICSVPALFMCVSPPQVAGSGEERGKETGGFSWEEALLDNLLNFAGTPKVCAYMCVCVCCTRFTCSITLSIAHAIIPKSYSNPCGYPYVCISLKGLELF